MVQTKKILVTMGEPAGIGPDILLKAWQNRNITKIPDFTVIGDLNALRERAKILSIGIEINSIDEANLTDKSALGVIALENEMHANPGEPDVKNAAGVVEAITRGAELVDSGKFDALVTCPINKAVLYQSSFEFPGHTEYLAHLASLKTGRPINPVMMLAGGGLRTVPVTIHIALEDVAAALTPEKIEQTVRITDNELKKKFGIRDPKIVVSALNPHAGENGAMGSQEIDFINDCIATLQAEGINVSGPYPADTMFHERARNAYDVAICMYHDQALIPVKTLAFDEGVNVTLGLPFIRTSPDHGTAFDIAGTGKARADSLIAAIRMADEMASHQGKQS